MSARPAPGDALELRVEKLVAGGAGLARTDEGFVVFVEGTAPGDRLRARITESRGRYARAELQELVEPGPGRREPPCAVFGRCGGCSWMHLDESAQRSARESILRDALRSLEHSAAPPPIEWLPSPQPLGYRARARVLRDGARVGFRGRRSHALVDVERCPVLSPATQASLEALRAEPQSAAQEIELRGFDDLLGLHVSPGAFAQANGLLWESWQDRVAREAGRGRCAVELYAGVGFYTVRLTAAFERVIAVERSAAARDLAENAPQAEVVEASAERFARAQLAELSPDLVLLNPPRRGASEPVMRAIAHAAPARIVYVSCDPATLVRDLGKLRSAYHIACVVLIDALPQTHHVETLVRLQRRDDPGPSANEGNA